ncbi:MAG TPA: ATP-binding protein [Vicinamibacteria bacterium]|nr:ATP-binding protein [Vicinamibacteria bacterium]
MLCPKCSGNNNPDAHRCAHCGGSLSVALLEVVRGNLPEKIYFLKPRSYTLGRARHNDLSLTEPSISKVHARIVHENDSFHIEDQGSLHGVYVNAHRVQRAELAQGTHVQLGNVTLKFSLLGSEGTTEQIAEFPWIEQQQLLLSLVQTLNSTLVLSQVLEQVLDAVMRITRAERGFLLLAHDDSPDAERYPLVADMRVRVARRRGGEPIPQPDVQGISKSVIKKAVEGGETVATGNAAADPSLAMAQSVIMMDLRTIVCIPLRSPRAEPTDGGPAGGPSLGAIYVDNPETSAPFSADSLKAAEALARHAGLAIENARLFEREKETIRELQQAQDRLLHSEKLATIGQMAAGIAHELNTPLTYIMGNLELLQVHPLTDPQRDMVTSISRGADRIKSLSQSLLAFSRPSNEELIPVAVNDVIERALELCHYQVLKGGVSLVRDLTPSAPRVRGVANQLEMALINLVVNGIHAMEGRGGTLTVGSTVDGDRVHVTVSDTGSGIPEAIRPTIFEPFFTTKPEGKGTGLGLSTVMMVVERHRGQIDFTTAEGRGTTFKITLPALS